MSILKEYIAKLDDNMKIEEISFANVPYKRPRIAGCNARLGVHGWGGDVPIARIKIGGSAGFGWSRITSERASELVGMPISSMFNHDGVLKEEYRSIEFPILDWLGNVFEKPVFALVAKDINKIDCNNFTVPVYDSTIYFDELDITDDIEAVEFICKEVDFGLANGHKNFKVKIGRCGMWMSIEDGMKRDIDIVLAIRKRIGQDGKLLVDANNGYNLNLAKRFLMETKGADIYWLEEAFHEDDQLYTALKQWMKDNDISTMISDGEGYACTAIVDWAKRSLIDIIQYDLKDYGFFKWMELGTELDKHAVQSAPHNYGGFYGNYAQAHFASTVDRFAFAEWDQADADGIDTSAYTISNGFINVPNMSGFGLKLDEEIFHTLSASNGFHTGV